jgi:hypothetical protein
LPCSSSRNSSFSLGPGAAKQRWTIKNWPGLGVGNMLWDTYQG